MRIHIKDAIRGFFIFGKKKN